MPGLMIPAFSAAILGSVSPKNCMWSGEMLVITHTSGVMMLVESSLPPIPTSITA